MQYYQSKKQKIASLIFIGLCIVVIFMPSLFNPKISFGDDATVWEEKILTYGDLAPNVFGNPISGIKYDYYTGFYYIWFENSRIALTNYETEDTEEDFEINEENIYDFSIEYVGEDCFDDYGEIQQNPSAIISEKVKRFYQKHAYVEIGGETIELDILGYPLTGVITMDDFPKDIANGKDVQWFEYALFDLSGTEAVLMPLGVWLSEDACRSDDGSSEAIESPSPTEDTPNPTSIVPPENVGPTPTGIHPLPTPTPFPDPYTPWTPTARSGGMDDDVPVVTPTLTTPLPTPVVQMFTDFTEDPAIFATLEKQQEIVEQTTKAVAPTIPAAPWDSSSKDESKDNTSSNRDDTKAPTPASEPPDDEEETVNPKPKPKDPPKQPVDPQKQPVDPPKDQEP